MNAYTQLEAEFRRLSALRGASSMLQWDSATMLPQGAAEVRGEQLAALSEVAHAIITAPRLAELLAEVEGEKLEPWQQANVREMQRAYAHENALPADLVAAITRAASASEMAWRNARKNNNFKEYIPHLKEIVELTRQAASAKAQALNLSPYDALIDMFDPGSRSAEIDVIFDDLAAFLPGFTAEVMERQRSQPAPLIPEGGFPASAQKTLGRLLMEKLGFDFTRGRLDESAHPFCGGVPGDVRLTTRYNESEFLQGLFGVIHETGHAVYEMQLPAQWRGQPVGEARGMGVHESQSLFFEKQIGHSPEFFRFLAPLIHQAFSVSGPAWEPENLTRLANRVQPGLIRVHADEVTYPSHIILRYRLEKSILSGDLPIEDLPAAWAEGMNELLGVSVPTDSDGCLQDIHWPEGMFGYFPSYTLGAMLAAQLFNAMEKELPQLRALLEKGDFRPITDWLRTHVHALGSSLSTPELITRATGEKLNPAIYKNHLRKRYLEN